MKARLWNVFYCVKLQITVSGKYFVRLQIKVSGIYMAYKHSLSWKLKYFDHVTYHNGLVRAAMGGMISGQTQGSTNTEVDTGH